MPQLYQIANFKFKELSRFNKKNNPLIFDVEVHVDFRLEVKKSVDPEGSTKSRIFGKIGDFIQNSGNGCPNRMQKLKNNIGKLSDQIDKERRTIGERGANTKKRRWREKHETYNKK